MMDRISWLQSSSSACLSLAFAAAIGCSGQITPGDTPGTAGNSGGGMGSSSGSGSSTGTGNVMGGGGAGVGNGGAGGSGPVGDPLSAGIKPLRLLTAREYVNTVADLLTDTTIQESALPVSDEDSNAVPSFAFHLPHPVATQDGSLFQSAAEGLARNAVTHLATLLPCSSPAPAAGAATTACLTTFLTTFMPKMYRRPLTPAESNPTTSTLGKLYAVGRSTLGLGFNDAIGLLIEAALQSPQFLYHWEMDATPPVMEGAVVKLGNYELANRLSYFLWGTMPDAPLFAAAATGQLNAPATVETQVRRMLKDTRATSNIVGFFSDWLDVDTLPDMPKDLGKYPSFNDALIKAMTDEFSSVITGSLTTGTGRLSDLLTGTGSYANQVLATLYSIPGVTGTALKPVTLPSQRAGLLTTGAFLASTGDASESNPPRRGKAILTKLMCGVMGIPPGDAPPAKPASLGGTKRQRMEEHDKNQCATACHSIIEPLGFAFEEFGGVGEFQTTDNGGAVDSTGSVYLDGQNHPYKNAIDLIKVLAVSPTVQSCFTTQWLRYGFGRAESGADQASISAATAAFVASQSDIRELIVGLTKSRTFLYRTPAPGEVLQ